MARCRTTTCLIDRLHFEVFGPSQEMEERLRDELDIRRRQAQKQHEASLQAAEDAQRLEALRKSLRGSDYTLDHQGQVVPLVRFDPENLPPLIALPSVTVTTPADKPERKAGRTKGGNDTQEAGKLAKPRQTLALDVPAYVEQRDQSQPSTIEAITLQPGCSIRQGASEKKGPQVAAQMTRAEFLQQKAGKVPLDSAQQATRSLHGLLSSSPTSEAHKASTGGEAKQRGLKPGKQMNDGGAPRSPLGPGQGNSPHQPRPVMQNRPVSPDDANLRLINAPDWGFSSSRGGHGGLHPLKPVNLEARVQTPRTVISTKLPRIPPRVADSAVFHALTELDGCVGVSHKSVHMSVAVEPSRVAYGIS
eukprot:jgi/Botrbrau1/17759/Bobra.0127s0017.2